MRGDLKDPKTSKNNNIVLLPTGQLDKTTTVFATRCCRYDYTPKKSNMWPKGLWQFTSAIRSFLNAGRRFHPPSLKTTKGDVSKYLKDLEGECVWSLFRINNLRHINTQDIRILRISSQHEGFVFSSPAVHQLPRVTKVFFRIHWLGFSNKAASASKHSLKLFHPITPPKTNMTMGTQPWMKIYCISY